MGRPRGVPSGWLCKEIDRGVTERQWGCLLGVWVSCGSFCRNMEKLRRRSDDGGFVGSGSSAQRQRELTLGCSVETARAVLAVSGQSSVQLAS